MVSLIITIISIALVAALALATLYYGGNAFNRGSVGADAASLINAGQQVNGAVAIYQADLAANITTEVLDLNELSQAGYLAQVPAPFDGATLLADKAATKNGLTAELCEEINKRAGRDATVALTTRDGVYGCTSIEGARTFYYKF